MEATGDRERIHFIHTDPAFERCRSTLRQRGGHAADAANKITEFVNAVAGTKDERTREKFRFTRNGENRIRHCRKIDLGCGYRLVCLVKDGHLVLLYAGTHDECFRWLERNSGMPCEVPDAAQALAVRRADDADHKGIPDRSAEDRIADAYEETLMSRLDDTMLRKVFSGIVNSRV